MTTHDLQSQTLMPSAGSNSYAYALESLLSEDTLEPRTLDLIGDHRRAAAAGVPGIDLRDLEYLDTPEDIFDCPKPTRICRNGRCFSID